MSNPNEADSKPQTQSKLGRGLGRLIPLARPAVEAKPIVASPPSVPPPQVAAKPITATRVRVSETDSEPTSGLQSAAKAVSVRPTVSASASNSKSVIELPLESIQPNSRQPRRDFDAKAIEELANSIRSAGLLQPVIVRPMLGASDRYELIAGERRLRACKHLGWKAIPAIVTNATDQNAGVWALIENVHRADLNPMDRALSLKQLAGDFRLTHEALAEQVGLDRSSVTNLLRLADLDETTASMVRKGLLSQGHAKALLGISSPKTRATLAESTVRGEWSVRALEREVQRLAEAPVADVPRGTQPTRRRTHIDALERKLSQALGTDVKIQTGRKPNTGKLQLSFYSVEQFEGLVSALGIKPSQIRLED